MRRLQYELEIKSEVRSEVWFEVRSKIKSKGQILDFKLGAWKVCNK